MKTRILFLDDEPLALQGLQRMLRNMRDAWDMVFVESGARALEVMNQSPVDLVVTDMLMPGMNGAQFLNEVRSRYPQTARLILSGHADKELILQCVGSAHQYLSKPCQPERLKEVLIRVCQLTVNLLGNTMAARTLNQIDRVPSVPSHYIEIVETLLDADVSLDDVTAIAAKDPGIAVTVLKLVNSPFFGTGRDISDVAKAISCLGLESFRALVFNVNAFSQFESTRFRELRIDAWARENLQVAAVARRITQAENADAKTCQDAHTAGLLHEIGGLVMASHFPEKYSDAVTLAKDRKVELGAAETQVLGISHSRRRLPAGIVGSALLLSGGCAVVSSPGRTPLRSFGPVTAVHVANSLGHGTLRILSRASGTEIDEDYLAQIGLADRLPAWRQCAFEDSRSTGLIYTFLLTKPGPRSQHFTESRFWPKT